MLSEFPLPDIPCHFYKKTCEMRAVLYNFYLDISLTSLIKNQTNKTEHSFHH